MMDDFEVRLKSLTTMTPSKGLRRRIFGWGPSLPPLGGLLRRRMPLGWAMSFGMAMGFAGFILARAGGPGVAQAPSTETAAVRVRIVEATTTRHVFDFTPAPSDFFSGDVSVRIESGNEV